MMRYTILTLLIILTAFPNAADDIPEVVEVARFGRGTAYTLAWRPDGEVLAVGSSTGVWFFDKDFNEIGRFAESMTVDSLEWSLDGTRFITFNNSYNDSYQVENCQLIIWNVSEDVQSVSQDKVLDYCAILMDWSSDGELIAISVADNLNENAVVKLISADTYEVEDEYKDFGIYFAFSPDSQSIAINDFTSKNPLVIIDINSNKVTHEIYEKETSGQPLWSSDSQYITTYCFDENFRYYGDGNCIWNVSTQELVFAKEPSILWNPVNNRFLTVETSFWGSPDRATFIGLHQDFSDETVFTSVLPDIVHKAVWHPSGEFFITLAFGQGISQFNGQTGELIKRHGLFQPRWSEVSWIPETTELLSISSNYDDQNSTVQVWSPDTNDTYTPERNQLIGDIDEISWIKNTQNFIVHSAGGMGYYWTNIWNAKTLEHVDMIYEHFDQENTIPTYRFSSDMNQVAIYAPDYHDHIEIVDDLYTRENPVEIDFQADRIRQMEWSSDDSMIATAGTVGDMETNYFLIEIWDADSGEAVGNFAIEWLDHYTHFIWNPDSSSIAVMSNRTTGGGCDMGVDVYNIIEGVFYERNPTTPSFKITEWGTDPAKRDCRVPIATWSSDGKLIATSFGKSISIFDPNNEDSLLVDILINDIRTLDWHESGQYLAGGTSDGTIYVWDVSTLIDE